MYSVHARETRGNAEKMSSPVYSVEGSVRKIPISFWGGCQPETQNPIVASWLRLWSPQNGTFGDPPGLIMLGSCTPGVILPLVNKHHALTVLDIFKLSILTSEIAS